MVIVVDDADRENEGDLVMAAEHATPAAINFMAKFGRGLICVPTTGDRLKQLGVERMVTQNRETFKTDFQVSVDAARGVTTGISAADRAKTIKSWRTRPRSPTISSSPATFSPSAPSPAASSSAPATPGRRGPRPPRRLPAHRRHLRDHVRRRHHGAPARAAEIRPQT